MLRALSHHRTLLTTTAAVSSLTLAFASSSSSQAVNEAQTSATAKGVSSGTFYPYVILGGGTTAYSAIEAIRQSAPQSPILVLSSERVVPSLHRGDRYCNNESTERSLGDDLLSSYNEWRRHITSKLSSEPDAIQSSKIHLLLRQAETSISPHNKTVTLDNGKEVKFGKLLIATAGSPRSFYVLGDVGEGKSERVGGTVNGLISLSDFEELGENFQVR